jgi:anti-sigma factor (TIGR02949 family)
LGGQLVCEDVVRRLEEYLDGEAAPSARAQFEAHLEGCPRCRQAADALRDLGAAVREAAGEPSLTPAETAAFWPAVRARLREAEAEAERRGLAGAARAVAWWLRPALLLPALAVLVGVVLGVSVLRTELWPETAEAVQVVSLEGGPSSTVMLMSEGEGKPPVIWIFEDGAGAN